MEIKTYDHYLRDVINEKTGEYAHGCVMLFLGVPNWDKHVRTIISEEDDLYEDAQNSRYGFETDPHVTLLYGLDPKVKDKDIEEAIKNFKEPKIEITGLSTFKNDKYDVVKYDVKGDKLFEYNNHLRQFPHTSAYSDYQPHITVAYVKSGEGDKYIKKEKKYLPIIPMNFVYSRSNGRKSMYAMN